MIDALRPESGCAIIARPSCLHDLDPVITESNYVLTPYPVPFFRFSGVWSFVDRGWIDIPNAGELFRMNDYDSDIDIAMHIAHHQFYWEKRMKQMVSLGTEVSIFILFQRNSLIHQLIKVFWTVFARQEPHRPGLQDKVQLMIAHVVHRKLGKTNAWTRFAATLPSASRPACARPLRRKPKRAPKHPALFSFAALETT